MTTLPENDRLCGPFSAQAEQTDYPADFPMIEASAVRVRVKTFDADEHLSPPSFEIVGDNEGGFTVRFEEPLPTLPAQVWIYSKIPPARLRSHMPNGAVRTAMLEDDATHMQAQLQEIQRDLGNKIGVDFGQAAPSAETIASAVDALEKLGTKVPRASLDALPDLAESALYLTHRTAMGDGFGGLFEWVSGDHSTDVDKDPSHGVWVPPSQDPSGRSGAWRRVVTGEYHLDWWGRTAAGVAAMASFCGYVKFPYGETLIAADLTISVPVRFDEGAYINTLSGATTTIRSDIHTTKQWVFRGSGSYSLGHNPVTFYGENARQVHASWFGAFPRGVIGDDQSPYIQKAIDAIGNTREGIVDFDIGNYQIEQKVFIRRGVWLRGSGIRRTVFKTATDGFDAFETAGVAGRMTDIQFENHLAVLPHRSSAWVNIKHDNMRIDRMFLGQSDKGIIIDGLDAEVMNITGAYGSAPAAGSSLVEIRKNNARISNVRCMTSAFGPEAIVRAKGTGLAIFEVREVQYVTPSIGVLVEATAGHIHRFTIDGVSCDSSTNGAVSDVVKVIAGGTFNCREGIITNVRSTGAVNNVITMECNSTGTLSDIVVNNVVTQGAQSRGISLTRTNGTMNNIHIGDGVDVARCPVPIYRSGVMAVKISPMAVSNGLPAISYDSTVPDDGVVAIELGRQVFTGFIMVAVGSTQYLTAMIRAASSPNAVTLQISANMTATNTPLTGTTGADGKFAVGVTDGVIYLENRLGSQQRVCLTLMTGVA